MADRPPGSVWLAEHWEELRKFNFLWVAATGDGVVAVDARLESVMSEVGRQGFTCQAVYALVDFDEPLGDDPPGPAPEGPPSCEPTIMPPRRASWR